MTSDIQRVRLKLTMGVLHIMNTHRHRNAWIIWLGVIIACGVAGWYIGATYDLSGGLQ